MTRRMERKGLYVLAVVVLGFIAVLLWEGGYHALKALGDATQWWGI